MRTLLVFWLCLPTCTLLLPSSAAADPAAVLSHPPLRSNPPVSNRPRSDGPAYFVDAAEGDDANDGSEPKPWHTIGHALKNLRAGDTLYLRGGTYYENVYVALHGREAAPITIRSFPGEQAIVDGGLSEFFQSPESSWVPGEDGADGQYRSARRYPNVRQMIGSFGDSMIGLNTYYHRSDLEADRETWEWKNPERRKEEDAEPLYCGPGLWYDGQSGYLHLRFAHTHLPGEVNYRGETDPRKLPLVIAPFQSVPLTIDGARHVRFQDLIIRGGGYDTIVVNNAQHLEFDGVTIWCGTYGMRLFGTEHLKVYRCSFYGSCPPWVFRSDSSKRAYPGRPFRDVTRLNTHASLIADAGREFEVYAHPNNDHWEIAYCAFTDAHDGPYLGGVNLRFHHNTVTAMQDDGIYLSQMYPRHLYMGGGAELHVYQNYFGPALTALAFGGPEDTRDTIYIYRNVFDLRAPIPTSRPEGYSVGKAMGDHGSPPWPSMFIYHNTFVQGPGGYARDAAMATLNASHPERPRHVLNNLFVHLGALPPHKGGDPAAGSHSDGNLYWSPRAVSLSAESFFSRYRKSPALEQSKAVYPPGFESHSLLADPKLVSLEENPAAAGDYRLQDGSPAVDAGAVIPAAWPDALREQDFGKPDVGAYPAGAALLKTGPAAAPQP